MRYDTLRARRVVRRIKLRALASKIGVQPWTLCRWEAGTRHPTDAEERTWRKALARLEKESA
jgi:hypothetical protein